MLVVWWFCVCTSDLGLGVTGFGFVVLWFLGREVGLWVYRLQGLVAGQLVLFGVRLLTLLCMLVLYRFLLVWVWWCVGFRLVLVAVVLHLQWVNVFVVLFWCF